MDPVHPLGHGKDLQGIEGLHKVRGPKFQSPRLREKKGLDRVSGAIIQKNHDLAGSVP